MLIQADSRPVEQTLISLENLVQCGKEGKWEDGRKRERERKERGEKEGRRVRERGRDFHTDFFFSF